MVHPMHESVVDVAQQAVALMDDLLRFRIDLSEYSVKLRALDVDSIMVAHEKDFKVDATLVYYLDALMLLSSLQHELDFQVAEYGVNVALEDMRNLQELMKKFSK
ncbi:MAG: hypothetical protein HY912_13925 [Desulfomonile tiedjei]|uniref:Uncharacterized protein n=1 Tax=Desulfomonile tiedjei TaxID=2358 RepID=A0A9D6V4C4_9BACT|nr:hypothetical protein [Desulfomonile tiedjei]